MLAVAGLAGPQVLDSPQSQSPGWFDLSVSGVGLLRHRPVSLVCGRSWILRFTDTDSIVPAEFCTIYFDPKTGQNRPRHVAPLVKDDAVRGAVVRVRSGDVKVAGGVERDVCGASGW